jgi:exonuclease III
MEHRRLEGDVKETISNFEPDILCFQETKINKNVKMEIEGYEYESHIGEKPGYSGTTILNIYRNRVIQLSIWSVILSVL